MSGNRVAAPCLQAPARNPCRSPLQHPSREDAAAPRPQSITCRRWAPGPGRSNPRDVAARASVSLDGGSQACSPPQGAPWPEERWSGREARGAVTTKGLRGWAGHGKPAPTGPWTLGPGPSPRAERAGSAPGGVASVSGLGGATLGGRGTALWGRAQALGAGLESGRDSASQGRALFF